jgi:hypothetical protein
MPKVVGFDRKAVAKKRTCRKCAAINEYTEGEVQEYHGTDISGGPDGQKWIVCANCGKDIILESW